MGSIYDLNNDTWTTMSLNDAPSNRILPVAEWTGTEVIIIGGTFFSIGNTEFFRDGARYNPSTDIWTPIVSNPDLEHNNVFLNWSQNFGYWDGTYIWMNGGRYDNTDQSFIPILNDFSIFKSSTSGLNSLSTNADLHTFDLPNKITKFCISCGDGPRRLTYQKVMHMYIKD